MRVYNKPFIMWSVGGSWSGAIGRAGDGSEGTSGVRY